MHMDCKKYHTNTCVINLLMNVSFVQKTQNMDISTCMSTDILSSCVCFVNLSHRIKKNSEKITELLYI